MPDDFRTGESGDNAASGVGAETMGARMHISVKQPQRGIQEHFTAPKLMPSIHGRNGSLEKVDPAITLTPLGGMMPGPNAIAPALPVHGVGAGQAFDCHEDGGFRSGVNDGYPGGPPVPVR